MEDDTLQSINRESRIGPVQVAHQILGQIAVLAAQAGVQPPVGEVACVEGGV